MTAAVTATPTMPSTSFSTIAALEGVPTGDLAEGEFAFLGAVAFAAISGANLNNFTQPAVGSTVTPTSTDTTGFVAGQTIALLYVIAGITYLGYYLVGTITANTSVVLTNLGNPTTAAAGAAVPATTGVNFFVPPSYYRLNKTSLVARNGSTVLYTAESNTAAPFSAPAGTPGRWTFQSLG